MSSKTQSTGDDSLTVFSQTSDEPYDRHDYELVMKSGKKIKVGDYETARMLWWNYCGSGGCSHIDVVDPIQKKKGGKGF